MPILKAYHRPSTVEEALQLLSRPGITTAVISGGYRLIPRLPETMEEVVDLQAVAGLTEVTYTGKGLRLGAMVRLQTIVDDERAPRLLRQAARLEGPNTFRHATTVSGVVANGDKDSEFLAALLVFDAEAQAQTSGGLKNIPLATLLRDAPSALSGGLITTITLATMGQTAADRVARTPADRPIVAALARRGEDDELRLALCGVANTPVLVDPANVKAGVNPPHDFRGSREYRRQMAALLSKRVLDQLGRE